MSERLRELAQKATPGPWGWFGNSDCHQMYLATRHSGRIFVMSFKRWGMQDAQPTFIKPIEDVPKPYGLITPASEHIVKEVPYRGDIVDIDLPDAQFIAAADPTTVLKLLDAATTAFEAIEALQDDKDGSMISTARRELSNVLKATSVHRDEASEGRGA